MSSSSVKFVVFLVVLSMFWMRTFVAAVDEELDYYDGDDELEDCLHEFDFKTLKKTLKLNLCSELESNSPVQIQILANHTSEKVRIRAISSSETAATKAKKSLISLTTDIIDDLEHPTSLMTIEDFQLIGTASLRPILISLIETDLKLLARNLKKTLVVENGGHKEILTCSGTAFPKQDLKIVNIKSEQTKPISCTKEKVEDRFFTLQEKLFLPQANRTTFKLTDIHAVDPKKIVRNYWFTCNNPASCAPGVQNKSHLDKTTHYVVKYLQNKKAPVKKKPATG